MYLVGTTKSLSREAERSGASDGTSPPASPRAPALIGKDRKTKGVIETPKMSLNLELDKSLVTVADSDLRQINAAPLHLENGIISSKHQPTGDQTRSPVSGTSADSDPVSASSEPDRMARRSHLKRDLVDVRRQIGSRSPRALDERLAKFPAAPGRGSHTSRSGRLFRVEPRDSGSMVPLLSPRGWTARSSEEIRHLRPRHTHRHDRKRNSPRGGKLPSLQFKVAPPRNSVRQQHQSDPHHVPGRIKLSPRCATADTAAACTFLRSALRGVSGQLASGSRSGMLAQSMLARETGRIQSNRRPVELEIET